MQEVVKKLSQEIEQGEHWFIALLKAIASIEIEECYLIEGEAFDWLKLTKELCQKINGQVSAEEINRFLLHSEPPIKIDAEEFKKLIGPVKYRACLNYFYGVIVEQALQKAVELEIRKRRRCLSLPEEPGLKEEVFLSLYGATNKELTSKFRQEKNYSHKGELNNQELKGFTYWLFKYRVKNCPPEKVASDTKKGLHYLLNCGQPPFINSL